MGGKELMGYLVSWHAFEYICRRDFTERFGIYVGIMPENSALVKNLLIVLQSLRADIPFDCLYLSQFLLPVLKLRFQILFCSAFRRL